MGTDLQPIELTTPGKDIESYYRARKGVGQQTLRKR